ncbi:syntaxin-binding protein 4 [Ambystoma mexicanum]|uniref:syntaxin-binding protein 4 n=1 Tax=Ambystoma mexicanum TaxID=8296 RepID=UPI0037E87F94
MATSTQVPNDDAFHTILVSKGTSLGLTIIGGTNRPEGPLVYIQEVIPGQDCHKDGRLRPGDQLVFINKESMIGVSYEEAKSILTRAKLRRESTWEIGFIRQKSISSNEGSYLALNRLGAPSEEIQQQTAASSFYTPCGRFDPKTSSTPDAVNTIQTKTSSMKTECSPGLPKDRSTSHVPASGAAPNRTGEHRLHGRKISLNPNVRVKVEKLQMALNYLGIQPTEEQQQSLRQHMKTYSEGTVSFGDFIQAARKVFNLQLDEGGIDSGSMMFGAHEMNNLLESQSSPHPSNNLPDPDDIERLKSERNEALREINKLKKSLFESESYAKKLSEELHNVKQESKAAVEETKALRSRIHLAEAAQRQARGMEMDYEEVIGLLENEISDLKAQLGDHSGQNKDNVQDLRKRITVLDCQLRKSEVARKTFEASTEKLLAFVEVVHEVLADNSGSLLNLSDRRAAFSSQTLLTRLGRNGRNVTATLASEAQDLAKSVRVAVEEDCLPYGWEEAYTADGIKFFINHVTQTTSWTHPVTSALKLSYSEDLGEDCPSEPPVPKS